MPLLTMIEVVPTHRTRSSGDYLHHTTGYCMFNDQFVLDKLGEQLNGTPRREPAGTPRRRVGSSPCLPQRLPSMGT